jgi:hypothetical protein
MAERKGNRSRAISQEWTTHRIKSYVFPGFTRFAQELYMIIEPDRELETGGLSRWTPLAYERAHQQAFATLDQMLTQTRVAELWVMVGLPGAGKSTWAMANNTREIVIFDAVFADSAARRRVADMARAAQVGVWAIWIDTPLLTCLHRNSVRPDDRRVPPPIIGQMHQKLSRRPPSVNEGFTQVRRVGVVRAQAA